MTAETEQTEQSEHDNKERTAGQDNWNRIAMAGQPVQDSRNRTAGTGKLEQVSWYRTAGTGQLRQDSWDRTARVTTGTGSAHLSFVWSLGVWLYRNTETRCFSIKAKHLKQTSCFG
jgi:hypothetical protein